jgi:hypothetical protein
MRSFEETRKIAADLTPRLRSLEDERTVDGQSGSSPARDESPSLRLSGGTHGANARSEDVMKMLIARGREAREIAPIFSMTGDGLLDGVAWRG